VTPAAELLQPDSNPALYVSAVLTLYVDLPDTPLRASASDQWLARRFHDDGVPLQVLETALLLGSLRRLIRPADAPRLSPIRSLAYFRPIIEELRAHLRRKATSTTSALNCARPPQPFRRTFKNLRFLMTANSSGFFCASSGLILIEFGRRGQ